MNAINQADDDAYFSVVPLLVVKCKARKGSTSFNIKSLKQNTRKSHLRPKTFPFVFLFFANENFLFRSTEVLAFFSRRKFSYQKLHKDDKTVGSACSETEIFFVENIKRPE